MPEYRPYLTDDGSIGLFSGDVNDVFHSRYGALSEAYEKFIFPANIEYYLNKKNKLNILDICYGIGYNSKALINYILKNRMKCNIVSRDVDNNVELGNDCIDSIVSDNNMCHNKNPHTMEVSILKYKKKSSGDDTSQTENLNFLLADEKDSLENSKDILHENLQGYPDTSDDLIVNIDALEYEKEFVYLSPLIKNNCYKVEYNLLPEVNQILLSSLIKQFGYEYVRDLDKSYIIKDKKKFFDLNYLKGIENYCNKGCKYTYLSKINALLHNIYYQHISKRPDKKNTFYGENYWNIPKRCFNIRFFIEDARITIKNLSNLYDVIFLDAFTPQKLPTLWSLDFFKILYNLLDDDGVLLTYSNSARIRNALLKSGFYVGKNKGSDENYIGTIASKNPNRIIHSLSQKEKGLLETKSGICYRDYNLENSSEDILKFLQSEIESSNLMTSSQYLKGVFDEI